MKYYRVKFGFGVDDFIVIDESELSKALRCQVNGTIAIFKEGSVAGKNIVAIIPDINRLMGWNRTYQPNAEDYGEISEKELNEHRMLMEKTLLQITGKQPDENKNLPPSNYSKELSDKFRV